MLSLILVLSVLVMLTICYIVQKKNKLLCVKYLPALGGPGPGGGGNFCFLELVGGGPIVGGGLAFAGGGGSEDLLFPGGPGGAGPPDGGGGRPPPGGGGGLPALGGPAIGCPGGGGGPGILYKMYLVDSAFLSVSKFRSVFESSSLVV